MKFFRVADIGPGVGADLGDGSRVEAPDLSEDGVGKDTAHLDGAGAALLEWSIIQIGVGIGV
jgi:hypothetical protein